jgi:hypothetical protein
MMVVAFLGGSMKKLFLAIPTGLMLFSVASFADTMTAYVSDAHCGAKHSAVSEANSKCISGCLKGGDAVLVSDGKVYKVDAASQDKVKALAGKDVTVDGAVSGDTVTVASIAAK